MTFRLFRAQGAEQYDRHLCQRTDSQERRDPAFGIQSGGSHGRKGARSPVTFWCGRHCVLKNGSLWTMCFLKIKLDSSIRYARISRFLKTSYFRAILGSELNWEGGRDFPCAPCPHTRTASPLSATSLEWRVLLLQLMNLRGHITITQSPQFTLGFTLGGVHSVGVDKCIMTASPF